LMTGISRLDWGPTPAPLFPRSEEWRPGLPRPGGVEAGSTTRQAKGTEPAGGRQDGARDRRKDGAQRHLPTEPPDERGGGKHAARDARGPEGRRGSGRVRPTTARRTSHFRVRWIASMVDPLGRALISFDPGLKDIHQLKVKQDTSRPAWWTDFRRWSIGKYRDHPGTAHRRRGPGGVVH